MHLKNKPTYAFKVDGKYTHPRVKFPFIDGKLTDKQKKNAIKYYAEHHGISHFGVELIAWNCKCIYPKDYV